MFTHQVARGYVSGLYGSQRFHRKECGLDPAGIAALAPGNAKRSGPSDHLYVKSLRPFFSHETEEP